MQADTYPQVPLQQPPPKQTLQNNDKRIGKKFKIAFILALVFLLLSNAYKFLENGYFLFTQKQFEIVNPETGVPTFKGYVIMTLVFFVIAFFL